MKIRKLLCLLGFHNSPANERLTPYLIPFNQRRNNWGSIDHRCITCTLWYETDLANELIPWGNKVAVLHDTLKRKLCQ